ncbi:MAG: thymidylate synthase [Clostridia bacterium]|nr:thymidylate synthase [Clostridia bacterium]
MKMQSGVNVKVRLLTYSLEPQRIVASAAKLCYSSADIDSIIEKQDDQNSGDFINMLMEMGHESPIEHAYFTFGIENVSRSLLAQITRHRIASFSVQSQRYVREKQFDFIIPPAIENNPEALEIYLDNMEKSQAAYDKIAEILKEESKNSFIEKGETIQSAEKKAEKAVLEDARFVLPNACATKIIMSMNARSLLNFFSQRCCNRAQWEIRELATQILTICREIAPDIFAKAGPSCLYAPCPEGKYSCGKIIDVREKFSKINLVGNQ